MVATLFILCALLHSSLTQYTMPGSQADGQSGCNLSLEELKGVIAQILQNVQQESNRRADYNDEEQGIEFVDIDFKPFIAGLGQLAQDIHCVLNSMTPQDESDLKIWFKGQVG